MRSNNNNLVQGKYVTGKQSVVGDPRRKWEDRVHASIVERANGEPLLVGIVADGVGSADLGARGAQLAIDTVLQELKHSQDDDIPALIEHAVVVANKRVYEDNQENEGDGLSTLVVMVIYQDRCYVGNVGDSRAYWVRGEKKKILQLTRDHSYYNIYGGDPNASNAGVVVNAIGNKPEVQVDLGFYLEPGIEQEKAYRLGYAGVPLQSGDAIVLCSDGLIKEDPQGTPYVQMNEIIDAVQSEYETDRAAIKMVSHAEGRRPDDNVSAVTIQYLTPDMILARKSQSEKHQKMSRLRRVGVGVTGMLAVAVIGFLVYRLSQKPATVLETVEVVITNTAMPTVTPTQPIDPGQARVDQVWGSGASVVAGQYVEMDTTVSSGSEGLWIVVGEQIGSAGDIVLFGDSKVQVAFEERMKPTLEGGAVYVRPGSGRAEVYFRQWEGVKATVRGSRMIVEVQENDIWVYCFEGECLLDPGGIADPMKIPVGWKRRYDAGQAQADAPIEMTADEKWDWNVRCHYCMEGVASVPTLTPTPKPVYIEPTKEKNGNHDQPTVVPPTVVPPTQVPPTVQPPTDPPPTDPPPTDPPPTDPPPTDPPPGPGKPPTKTPKK